MTHIPIFFFFFLVVFSRKCEFAEYYYVWRLQRFVEVQFHFILLFLKNSEFLEEFEDLLLVFVDKDHSR